MFAGPTVEMQIHINLHFPIPIYVQRRRQFCVNKNAHKTKYNLTVVWTGFSKCNFLSAFQSRSSLKHFHLSFKPLQLFICEFSQFFFAELFKRHSRGKFLDFKTVLFLALAKGDLSKPSKANMETDSKSLESKKNNAPLPSAAKVKVEPLRKYISIRIKRQIWQRAQAQCEHLDHKTNQRCKSRFALEADHIEAIALGGSNELENLRLLCRAHNSRRAAEPAKTKEVRSHPKPQTHKSEQVPFPTWIRGGRGWRPLFFEIR
jgi:5-methylcytosine-specific restriction endonuclease McrA